MNTSQHMSPFGVTIFTGEYGRKYYKIDGDIIYYDINFPLTCAIIGKNYGPKSQLTPGNCLNCQNFASYNGIQISVCRNCAVNVPEFNIFDCDCTLKTLQDHIDYQYNNYKTCPGYMILECNNEKGCIFNDYYNNVNFLKIKY